MDHGPGELAQLLGLLAAYDDHVESDFEVAELAA